MGVALRDGEAEDPLGLEGDAEIGAAHLDHHEHDPGHE
jgi:hypothetical protein